MGLIFPIYLYRKLKNLLVRNQWTDFNITWQECFFGDPLPRLFKLSWSSKNMAARGWAYFSLYVYIKKIKNLLVRNRWTELNVAWQECCFCNPLPGRFKPSWYVKKHGLQGGGAYFRYISVQKTLKCFLSDTSWPISIKLWWPSNKNVQAILICQKNMPARGWGLFSLYI